VTTTTAVVRPPTAIPLADAMRAVGLGDRDLADLCDQHPVTPYRVRHGISVPALDQLAEYCTVLRERGLDVTELDLALGALRASLRPPRYQSDAHLWPRATRSSASDAIVALVRLTAVGDTSSAFRRSVRDLAETLFELVVAETRRIWEEDRND